MARPVYKENPIHTRQYRRFMIVLALAFSIIVLSILLLRDTCAGYREMLRREFKGQIVAKYTERALRKLEIRIPIDSFGASYRFETFTAEMVSSELFDLVQIGDSIEKIAGMNDVRVFRDAIPLAKGELVPFEVPRESCD